MGDDNINLPPGFRFRPTDEELVHFLYRKAALSPCQPDFIPDLELYPYDPWELSGKALEGDNQWYFFSRRTSNRISENGYWNPLGVDEPIFTGARNIAGMKKLLVFYLGEAPEGDKTNWMMQEYRLSDSGSSSSRSSRKKGSSKRDLTAWVICRVYQRNDDDDDDTGIELSCLDEVFLSFDDLDEISLPN
ncbi:PREDICTED: NAC domain-containing protein 104-like [Nelumbo nucifera]|uniref:NAC domain-containing protein 104-like n=2 Tax=Nelumbo nucifera TaxID=4432 RepID=A0A1U8ADZ6_NELNU|nr:PREDICTED: NAC domain-containing protein 104-like [Nelumbo nucifera]DAD17751.1 TPA_asm: hypothetical protein HUJ06_019214 [Nelumbo nucifera]